MHDDVEDEKRRDRDAAKRAECFARLVLTREEDAAARKLIDYAERTAERIRGQRNKTITWLSLALSTPGVDDSTLTGLGFDTQDVRHATVLHRLEDETATAYAARLAAYNEPEAFAIGKAMLSEPVETNPGVPAGTTAATLHAAVATVQSAQEEWSKARAGQRPPAGGVADERPTAPGLADAIRRLEHHVRMIGLTLHEMARGPGETPWGVVERLALDDLGRFLNAGSELVLNAAAIVIETSNLTATPASGNERSAVRGAREEGIRYLDGIAVMATTIHKIATRLTREIPLPAEHDETVH